MVSVTDLIASRLVVTKSLGADGTSQVACNHAEVEIAQGVEAALGEGPFVTIECAGAEKSFRAALIFLGKKLGGCVVLVGLGSSERTLQIAEAVVRQVNIRGVLRYANCYPNALEMTASGKFDLKKLITHRFPIEESRREVETAEKEGGYGLIKVIICS